jgi:hypothetical protein
VRRVLEVYKALSGKLESRKIYYAESENDLLYFGEWRAGPRSEKEEHQLDMLAALRPLGKLQKEARGGCYAKVAAKEIADRRAGLMKQFPQAFPRRNTDVRIFPDMLTYRRYTPIIDIQSSFFEAFPTDHNQLGECNAYR